LVGRSPFVGRSRGETVSELCIRSLFYWPAWFLEQPCSKTRLGVDGAAQFSIRMDNDLVTAVAVIPKESKPVLARRDMNLADEPVLPLRGIGGLATKNNGSVEYDRDAGMSGEANLVSICDLKAARSARRAYWQVP